HSRHRTVSSTVRLGPSSPESLCTWEQIPVFAETCVPLFAGNLRAGWPAGFLQRHPEGEPGTRTALRTAPNCRRDVPLLVRGTTLGATHEIDPAGIALHLQGDAQAGL